MGLSNEIIIRLKDGSELGIVSDRHVFYDDFFIDWKELSREAQEKLKKMLSTVEKMVTETMALGG